MAAWATRYGRAAELPANLSPRWLDLVGHRIRGFRVPYLLILQHHDIPGPTLLAAPVTASMPGDVDVLAPPLIIRGEVYRARILDMSAVPRGTLSEHVASAATDCDAIMGALDIILHGYPVGASSFGRGS